MQAKVISHECNGPGLWKNILSHAPDGAIIAGQCVADYLLGTSSKDIDVFIPPKWNSSHKWPENWSRNVTEKSGDYPSECFHSEYFLTPEGYLVNVIYLNHHSPVDYMYEFDINLCKCLYDGNLFFTQEALDDHLNGRLTLNNSTELTYLRAYNKCCKFKRELGEVWEIAS